LAGVEPAKGREGTSFAVSQVGGHLGVIPRDALAALADGLLDERLFDVSTLLEFGYDDRRSDLPLIVIGEPGAMSKTKNLRSVPGGAALRVSKGDLAGLWSDRAGVKHRSAGKTKLWLDGLRKPTLDQSVTQIKAPVAWQAGYTGTGVKVAVVDTGIDATHPDLAGQVIAARDFVGDGHDLDVVGHGTHVAATISSKGGT
jgi:subtilisin family serine protease